MKILIAFIAAIALLFAITAQAQPTYGTITLLSKSGLTNGTIGACLGLSGSQSDWSSQVVDCRKADNVAIQVTGSASVTEANVVSIGYGFSVDGSTYDGASGRRVAVVTCSPTGGSPLTVCTNIPTLGMGYIKILNVTNAASAGGLTNLTITASQKLLQGK